MKNTFSETTINLLSEEQKRYLNTILTNREYWKNKGYVVLSIESDFIYGNKYYRVFTYRKEDIAIEKLHIGLSNEIIERIEL